MPNETNEEPVIEEKKFIANFKSLVYIAALLIGVWGFHEKAVADIGSDVKQTLVLYPTWNEILKLREADAKDIAKQREADLKYLAEKLDSMGDKIDRLSEKLGQSVSRSTRDDAPPRRSVYFASKAPEEKKRSTKWQRWADSEIIRLRANNKEAPH